MPLTASIGSGGGIPGLTLRAWALVSPAGALLAGFNVSTVTKGSAGKYQLNLSQAMADTTVFHEVRFPWAGANRGFQGLSATAATIAYDTTEGGVFADVPHYLAIYGK